MDRTENSAPEALCTELSVQSIWHPLYAFFWRKRTRDLSLFLFIKMARPHTIFVLASRFSQYCLASFAGLTVLDLSVHNKRRIPRHEDVCTDVWAVAVDHKFCLLVLFTSRFAKPSNLSAVSRRSLPRGLCVACAWGCLVAVHG